VQSDVHNAKEDKTVIRIGIVGVGFMGINRFWFLSYFTEHRKTRHIISSACLFFAS
jgi:hypothetical protein